MAVVRRLANVLPSGAILCTTSAKLPLSMYSITMERFCGSTITPIHSTTRGCRRRDRMLTSDANTSCPAPRWSKRRFTATGVPRQTPLYTSPYPPMPSLLCGPMQSRVYEIDSESMRRCANSGENMRSCARASSSLVPACVVSMLPLLSSSTSPRGPSRSRAEKLGGALPSGVGGSAHIVFFGKVRASKCARKLCFMVTSTALLVSSTRLSSRTGPSTLVIRSG
mmetsp:Transcript_7204/g.18621  ORF Transcript_7204/g.18621 Transcript_7204/m.18621 type:complete len:224 (+) Transcript_7204:212-883(+)